MNPAFETAINFYQGFLIIYFCKNFFRGKENTVAATACALSAGVFLCLHEYFSFPIPDTVVFFSGFVYMSVTKRGTWPGRSLCCVLLAALWIACVITANEIFSALYGTDVEVLLQYNQDNRISYLLASNVFITIWVFAASRIVRRNRHVKAPRASAFLFLALLISEWLGSELVFAGSANAGNTNASSVSLCFLMLFSLLMTLLIYDYYCKTLERAAAAENEARMLIDSKKHQGDLNGLYQALLRTQHDMRHRIAIAETMLINGSESCTGNDSEHGSGNGSGDDRGSCTGSGGEHGTGNGSGDDRGSCTGNDSEHDIGNGSRDSSRNGGKGRAAIKKALTEGINPVEVFYTGNETTDAILTAKYATAKTNGIEFRFQPYSLKKHPLNDITFGILMGNLLDNAIEAVKKIPHNGQERYVELCFTQKMEMFCISCVNPTMEEHVEITSDQILRRREKGHGYGLDSIRQTVESNNGKCIISSEGHMFRVNILIPFGDEEIDE